MTRTPSAVHRTTDLYRLVTEASGGVTLIPILHVVVLQGDFGFNEHHQNEIINYMRFARAKRILRLKTIDSCFQDLKDSR